MNRQLAEDISALKEKITVKILFVDDEENILKALRRLMMDEEYEVFTATSGEEGLRILKEEKDIGVIVSDQRMPGLSGVDFLEKAREINPYAVRIILTGYADINAAIDAINRGGAYRYVSKPWKDEEMLQLIKEAASRYCLVMENRRLIGIINRQNEELKKWNTELEKRVQEQTEELKKKNEALLALKERIERNFKNSIEAFSSLLELRNAAVKDHSRKVAELSCLLSKSLGLSEEEVETIRIAALLHDIGKIGMPDLMLQKDVSQLSDEEMEEYKKHPVRGQAAIDIIEDLRDAGVLIRHHHENYDGSGFPDGLKGKNIPVGARVISLADFVDWEVNRWEGKNSIQLSLNRVKENLYRKFDPDFYGVLEEKIKEVYSDLEPETDMIELELNPDSLRPGMILAKDVVSGTGLLLLRKGTTLDDSKIDALKRFYRLDPSKRGVFVFVKR